MILALETSALVASVALITENGVLGELTLNSGKTHSQKLMPAILELMNHLEIPKESLKAVAVSAGPGSFTGIRIGMASAKGIAHGLNLPIYPVSSLEALAWNLGGCTSWVCPIMDARRDQVYMGLYHRTEEGLQPHWEDAAMGIEELIQKLKDQGDEVWFVGDGVEKYQSILKENLNCLAKFPSRHLWLQRASSVGMAVLNNLSGVEAVSFKDAVPSYIRKSQAERMRNERSNP